MINFCGKDKAFVLSMQRKWQEIALQTGLQAIDLLRVTTSQDSKTLQGGNVCCKSAHYKHGLQGGEMGKNCPRQLIL